MTDNVLERVERIEKRNKFLIGVVALLLAAVMVMLYYNVKSSQPLKLPAKLVADTIRVNTVVAGSIQVVASHGKNSILLGATEDGWTILSFRGLDGVQKAALAVTPSGKPSLDLFSDKATRLSLGVVDSVAGQGEEFSLQLKDKSNNVIWHPDVVNPY
jgi:hypothetical protein